MTKRPTLFQAWSVAARLRTVPIPLIQVFTAAALAYSVKGSIQWWIFLCTCMVGVFITIGTNLINDVIDFEKGADKPNRKGFLKVISAGLIAKEHVRIAGLISFALALLFALPLAIEAGWIVFGFILLSVVCGYCYTGGPYPISYLGLSEVFILLFYGFVCVGVAFYVQTKSLSLPMWICALQMGLLAILPNALNNYRDMNEDANDGKYTLAVRFGKVFAQREVVWLTFLPFVIGLLWLFAGYTEAALFPLLLIPFAWLFMRAVYRIKKIGSERKNVSWKVLFGLGILLHFSFGLLLVIGFLLN